MNPVDGISLEDIPLEELYEWLDEIKLSRLRSRNISRDFSDGVLMAEVLKIFYPRHVELHNYSPANSLHLKINNWITLNNKVLKKLDLPISEEKISALASAVPGEIEGLLKEVKRSLNRKCEQKSIGNVNYFDMVFDGNQPFLQIDQENIDWDKVQREFNAVLIENTKLKSLLDEKDECIKIMQQKLAHLEAMMELKDQRINDLGRQLNRNQEQDVSSRKTISDLKMF